MKLEGEAKRLRIYIGQSDKWHGKPLDSAIVGFTKSLALELGKHQITVNALAPGGTNTPGARELWASLARSKEAQEFFSAKTPKQALLGRMGEPDDIAKVVLFLVSGTADYMTGSLVVVDGGYLLA